MFSMKSIEVDVEFSFTKFITKRFQFNVKQDKMLNVHEKSIVIIWLVVNSFFITWQRIFLNIYPLT